MNKVIKIILGILILAILVYKVGVSNIISALKGLNMLYAVPLMALYPIIIIIGTINLKLLLTLYENNISIIKLLKYQLKSYTLGLVTPGNLGEFYIIKLLKNEGLSTEKGMVVSSVDKIITATVLGIASLIGSLFLFGRIIDARILAVVMSVIIVLGLAIMSRKTKELLKFILKKYQNNLEELYKEFKLYVKNGKKQIMANLVLTTIKWLITAVGIKILIMGFGFNVQIITVFLITCTARFISLIPITFSGIGIKESIAVLLYSQFNIPSAVVVSVYLIYMVINYLLGAFVAIIEMSDLKQENHMPSQ